MGRVQRHDGPAAELTGRIIGAAIEVHRVLGSGLLESAYEECLAYELDEMGLRVQRQLSLPVVYKGRPLGVGYRLDLLVEDVVVIEVKGRSGDRADPQGTGSDLSASVRDSSVCSSTSTSQSCTMA